MSNGKPVFDSATNAMLASNPFWSMFGNFARTLEPVGRNVARTNCELSSLAGERARAYMAIPETLAHCRTPVDLLQAQMAFWQVASRQYADTTGRLLAAWQVPSMFTSADSENGERAARDYITFPEPRTDEASEDRRHPGSTRRAA